ncbi:MAG: hypothetical protein KDJ73_00320 [Notoacmeibacter sp.]|nr:hypothetical protein [Notoacmeibacter sp.]
MTFSTRIVALLLFLFAAPALAANQCDNADVVVSADPGTDIGPICEAARKAIDFLAGIGVPQMKPVVITIRETIPARHAGSVGCYDNVTAQVYVKGIDACRTQPGSTGMFGLEMDEEIYASVVAHEVAHAISAQNFRYEKPPVAAWEYIAGVAQFSVMEAGTRDRILENTRNIGFDSIHQINGQLYFMVPAVFLASSYLHFHTPEGGPEFVKAILAGTIRLADDAE